MLKWRLKIRKELEEAKRVGKGNTSDGLDDVDGDAIVTVSDGASSNKKPDLNAMTEDDIQNEISQIRDKVAQEQRREKKKDRVKARKDRARQALGMNENAFEVGQEMELFSLSTGLSRDIGSDEEEEESDGNFMEGGGGTGRGLRRVPVPAVVDVLDLIGDEYIDADEDDDGGDLKEGGGRARRGVAGGDLIEYPEDELEEELEEAYMRYVRVKRSKSDKDSASRGVDLDLQDAREASAEGGRVRSAKRARVGRTPEGILAANRRGDKEMALEGEIESYAQMLTGGGEGSGEEDGGEDEDDDDASAAEEPMNEKPDSTSTGKRSRIGQGALAASVSAVVAEDAGLARRVDKWFSHPIFQQSSVATRALLRPEDEGDGGRSEGGSDAALAVLSAMPRTDREVRKEKRKKEVDRQERRAKKRRAALVEADNEEEDSRVVAPSVVSDDEEAGFGGSNINGAVGGALEPLEVERRRLIKEGMGKAANKAADAYHAVVGGGGSQGNRAGSGNGASFEVVPLEQGDHDSVSALPRADDRTYGSDEEHYDAHDRAMTLALGTMMLRRSRQKALVDASYNRYAWNDAIDLPEWFIDDEMKHNKPQLPVPNALLEQIKSRFQKTGTKDIKKVAEARARKRKRAMSKLKAAKNQANLMAQNSEMSEKAKIKAISKAMKSPNKTANKPSKVYVVTRKTKAGSVGNKGGGKGMLKFVDKRMKKEKRALKAKEKRGKK
eukprot:gene763-847_t